MATWIQCGKLYSAPLTAPPTAPTSMPTSYGTSGQLCSQYGRSTTNICTPPTQLTLTAPNYSLLYNKYAINQAMTQYYTHSLNTQQWMQSCSNQLNTSNAGLSTYKSCSLVGAHIAITKSKPINHSQSFFDSEFRTHTLRHLVKPLLDVLGSS